MKLFTIFSLAPVPALFLQLLSLTVRRIFTVYCTFHLLFFTSDMSGSPLVYLCPVYTSETHQQPVSRVSLNMLAAVVTSLL